MEGADMEGVKTIDQVIEQARARLGDGAYLYASAGAGQEVTLERNTVALRSLGLVPSVLAGIESVDLSTSLLGIPLALPVVLAPVGSLELFDPGGAAAAARGAIDEGTFCCVGVLSSPTLEEVQQTAPGRHVFQLYVQGDRGWLRALIERVEAAGYGGLCLTADSPVPARRDRLFAGGFDWRMEREGLPVNLVGLGRDRSFQARMSWSDLEYLRGITDLPIALKGVLRGHEAAQAVDAGVDAVYVSNHGGRAMDHGISSVEGLRDVVEAVGDRAQVVVDSGFTRGADICKAIALGADAVAVGRLQCWGLAIGGSAGVARVLQILAAELRTTMTMLGCSTLADLRDVEVRPTFPV